MVTGITPVSAVAGKAQDAKEGKESSPPELIPLPTESAPGPISTAVGCASCGSGCCVPGRTRDCCGCNRDSIAGRIYCDLYEELCCPDPCYEGKWIAAANAAFFVEGTRPVTTTRIRWEYGNDFRFPDRSEFFWAGINNGGKGGKGVPNPESSLSYSQLGLYQEIAAKGFSFFTEIPYLAVDPDNNRFAAGFGDIKLGTKALLFDRDLLQVGFMFTTFIPSGNFSRGLGTGHISLEPTLLATLKLTPDTYFQSQLSEWIPLGTDTDFQGSVLHYHFSLNHVLCRPLENVQLIGTAEFNGYSFQAGEFTDPSGNILPSGGTTYVSMGPGLRLVICDWIDFGFGTAFALGDHGPDQVYRTELRIRY